MLIQKLAATLIFLAFILGSGGCRPTLAPVYAPHTQAGVRSSGSAYTIGEIKTAVFTGLQNKGWRTISVAPGNVEAEIASGKHTARVKVHYDAQGWAIDYVSSSPGLKYQQDSEHGGIIHRRYNHWIRLLDEAISQALPSLPAAK
ncbi:MAG: hypothetical protein H6715_03220 [Myxococcales bacterium]|nr:hypothetical protein [Myxococcales bacterium]MCB9708857.1 hypothetical protein [Myxococcales bacterium]